MTLHRPLSTSASDAWRDHLLREVVDYLQTNRDAIIERFATDNAHGVNREQIEANGLLDFDVAITLHRDRTNNFGLGSGFFKANLIR